jgi:hypothetical protein
VVSSLRERFVALRTPEKLLQHARSDIAFASGATPHLSSCVSLMNSSILGGGGAASRRSASRLAAISAAR